MTIRTWTVALATLGIVTSAALAQPSKKGEDPPVPPQPSKMEDPGSITAYLVGIVLVGAIFGISAMPSRRGHQD